MSFSILIKGVNIFNDRLIVCSYMMRLFIYILSSFYVNVCSLCFYRFYVTFLLCSFIATPHASLLSLLGP